MISRRKPLQQALAEVLSGGGDVSALLRAPDGRAPRVLVAEPDPDLRDRLRRVLASAACDIDAEPDAEAAAEAAKRRPPDLAIVALELPPANGFALLRALRADPASRSLPVLMIGAQRGEPAKSEALDAGADDYLTKPIGARDLLSRVGLHLAMARVGREASEAVRSSERRLAEVLEAIGDAVYAVDRDERILFANRRALEMWGRREDAVIGRPLLEVFPGIAGGEPYQAYQAVLATREPVHLETRAPALGNRWIGLDVHPGPQGGLVVAFRDIDERKQAEERLRLIVEALPDMAFVIAPNGVAEHYNAKLRDYVGAPIGPLPPDRSALHPPEDRARVDRVRADAYAAEVEFTVEARMRRHDGVYRWHRIHNRPVRIDGRIAFWLGTAVDIDEMREANQLLEQRVAERTAELEAANRRLAAQIEERERAEAQLRRAQRIEAVGQLTSGIAHDFNNLLTAVIGNLELLEARLGPTDDRLARLLTAARAAAERGSRLTAQLLAFSRQQRMTPEPIDLNRVVTSMGSLLQSTIGATIRIETALANDLWPALADASQIELVLLNLAINARDAMEGAGSIAIETANVVIHSQKRPEEPPAGEYAMVSVADTGGGIPPEILDKVFDPFFTTKEVGKGSGLGLSQVLGVAQQLGGGVSIETRRGRGTAVRVYLPRAGAERGESRRGASSRNSGPALRGAARILLVDDDNDVRSVAAAMLREAGHEVTEAGSAGAALDRLDAAAHRVELLIADIAMPGMSGIELARAVRERRPDLPILFISGFADKAAEARGLGVGDILQKPFRAAELTARVGAALGAGGMPGNVVSLRARPG